MGSNKENKFSKEYVEKIIKDCNNIADFCRKVGWKPMGDNYRIFHKYVFEYNLDISHFTKNVKNVCIPKNSDEYLHENSFKITSNKLLKKILNEGKKEYRCECCGNTEWMGRSIPLELHHINGDHYDNRYENLMVICPNCHAQTDNYRGKKSNDKKHFFCKNCGKELYSKAITELCLECYREYEKSQSKCPSKVVLQFDFNLDNNLSSLGRKYGVSSRTVKKWLKNNGII